MKIKIVKNYNFEKNVIAARENIFLNELTSLKLEKSIKRCKDIIYLNWSNLIVYTKLYLDNIFYGGAVDEKTFFLKEDWFKYWEGINKQNEKYFQTEKYKKINGDDKTEINGWKNSYKLILKDK